MNGNAFQVKGDKAGIEDRAVTACVEAMEADCYIEHGVMSLGRAESALRVGQQKTMKSIKVSPTLIEFRVEDRLEGGTSQNIGAKPSHLEVASTSRCKWGNLERKVG